MNPACGASRRIWRFACGYRRTARVPGLGSLEPDQTAPSAMRAAALAVALLGLQLAAAVLVVEDLMPTPRQFLEDNNATFSIFWTAAQRVPDFFGERWRRARGAEPPQTTRR